MATPAPSDSVIGLVLLTVSVAGLAVWHTGRRVLRALASSQ